MRRCPLCRGTSFPLGREPAPTQYRCRRCGTIFDTQGAVVEKPDIARNKKLQDLQEQIALNKAKRKAPKKPQARMVNPGELAEKNSLLARDHIPSSREDEPWVMSVPELNVINSAKSWARHMQRLAKDNGYKNMKTFFKDTDLAVDADKRLYDMVENLVEYEQGKKR